MHMPRFSWAAADICSILQASRHPWVWVRRGTGRDAADVAFPTMFGAITSHAPPIAIETVDDAANGFILPRYEGVALSSMAGL